MKKILFAFGKKAKSAFFFLFERKSILYCDRIIIFLICKMHKKKIYCYIEQNRIKFSLFDLAGVKVEFCVHLIVKQQSHNCKINIPNLKILFVIPSGVKYIMIKQQLSCCIQ